MDILKELEKADLNLVGNFSNLTGLTKSLDLREPTNFELNIESYEFHSVDRIINSNLIVASQVNDQVWNKNLSGVIGKIDDFIYNISGTNFTNSEVLNIGFASDPWWSEIYLYLKHQKYKKETKTK
ncbi:hypothetical protein GcM1_138005 [Golovinomyces cichoracearum]|uniref:Uncharacterized protein n=1 Tax=Golovinomyces cichoracearum TaxID=62708 RepID=A0A420JBR2_9PEZI|nr:hypothetical protein GcM1_138005 [Golovinomyces cichoracearum]